mgnify:CR=1 FL=1
MSNDEAVDALLEAMANIIGPNRGYGTSRDQDGQLSVVIEHLSDEERRQIEEAVGETIKVQTGGAVRRLPRRKGDAT